mmetsp:Transcript_120763/g.352713  ORF Transcript_120763/g.352713 Transcript_120763/m.352713 type:complete len:323 (-) Transcript_120763:1347-2315(-)
MDGLRTIRVQVLPLQVSEVIPGQLQLLRMHGALRAKNCLHERLYGVPALVRVGELLRRQVVDAAVCLGERVQHERAAKDDTIMMLKLHLAVNSRAIHLHPGQHDFAAAVRLDFAVLCGLRSRANPHSETFPADVAYPWRYAQTTWQLEVASLVVADAVLPALHVGLEHEAAAEVRVVGIIHQARQGRLQALVPDVHSPGLHGREVPAGDAELLQGLLPLRHHLLGLVLLVLPPLLVVFVQLLRPLHSCLNDILGTRLIYKCHLLFEPPELLLQALHKAILVYLSGLLCLHFDILHRGSKFQRAKAFLKVGDCRAQRPYHRRL